MYTEQQAVEDAANCHCPVAGVEFPHLHGHVEGIHQRFKRFRIRDASAVHCDLADLDTKRPACAVVQKETSAHFESSEPLAYPGSGFGDVDIAVGCQELAVGSDVHSQHTQHQLHPSGSIELEEGHHYVPGVPAPPSTLALAWPDVQCAVYEDPSLDVAIPQAAAEASHPTEAGNRDMLHEDVFLSKHVHRQAVQGSCTSRGTMQPYCHDLMRTESDQATTRDITDSVTDVGLRKDHLCDLGLLYAASRSGTADLNRQMCPPNTAAIPAPTDSNFRAVRPVSGSTVPQLHMGHNQPAKRSSLQQRLEASVTYRPRLET